MVKRLRTAIKLTAAVTIFGYSYATPVQFLQNTLTKANPTISQSHTGDQHRAPDAGGGSFLEPTLRAIRFWRHVGPIVVHYKFTELWFKVAPVDSNVRRETWDKLHSIHAQTGLKVILDLRGLFVKIGQVMSSRADFIPRPYIDVFSSLQDSVPPWDDSRIKETIRDSLESCQGLQLEEVFESIGEVLGSASIGQVHKAKLTSTYGGDTVALKVMHPNTEQMFRDDFKVFRTLCRVALPGWDPILRELELQMMTEFDYNNEANNLLLVRNNIAKSPYANKVVVPEPKLGLCSKRLLVMDYLSGNKLASHIERRLASILDGDLAMARQVLKAKQQALFQSDDDDGGAKNDRKGFLMQLNKLLDQSDRDFSNTSKAIKALQLASMTHDARKKLNLLLDVTGHQIFNDGLYNGDPHPGNILVLNCGRLGLIDYGQTRRLTKHDRLALAEVVASLGKSIPSTKINMQKTADAMREFGFRSRDSNDENIAEFAALYFDSDNSGRKMGFATPQKYLQYLNSIDPMVEVPDAAVFVARTSFLFRGLGALLQQSIHTCQHWRKHALTALETNGDGRPLYNLGLRTAI